MILTSNGFQGSLMETHIWAMSTLSRTIRWIHYWNLTTLRTLWTRNVDFWNQKSLDLSASQRLGW